MDMPLFFKMRLNLPEKEAYKAFFCRVVLGRIVPMAFGALLGASGASAQSVQVLGEFRDWSAYTANDGGGPICFTMSKPKETQPEPAGYTDAFVYLTHRPSQGLRNEFNMIAGYEFAPDSVAIAKVGSNIYELFTSADAAWLSDPEQGEAFARDLRSGTNLLIEGSSVGGENIVQTFSLSGATASSRAINSACR